MNLKDELLLEKDQELNRKENFKMGDIYIGHNEDGELTHSAKGSTWQKKGAAYISRKKVNGKWVYTYNNLGKRLFNNSINNEMDRANYGVVRNDARFLDGYPKSMVGKTVKQVSDQHYSNAESLKRKQVSGQRNIEKDPRYKLSAKTAYLKNKASRAAKNNVAKGKKKVSEILTRLRESAAAARTEANKKARAARTQATIRKTQAERAKKQANIQKALNKGLQSKSKAYKQKRAAEARKEKVDNTVKAAKSAVKKAQNTAKTTARKTKKKIKNAVSVKETAYITDVSTGKRRPAPTDMFDNATTAKRSISFTPRKKKRKS